MAGLKGDREAPGDLRRHLEDKDSPSCERCSSPRSTPAPTSYLLLEQVDSLTG